MDRPKKNQTNKKNYRLILAEPPNFTIKNNTKTPNIKGSHDLLSVVLQKISLTMSKRHKDSLRFKISFKFIKVFTNHTESLLESEN